MYELVLMMALSNGPTMASMPPEADAPAVKTYGLHGHREYRHRRRGCCGGGWGGGSGGWGCTGGYAGYAGCTGGNAGYGGSMGCTGGYAGYGGCTGAYGGNMGGYGGCTGGYAGYAGSMGCTGGHAGSMGGYAGYAGCTGGGYAMFPGSMGGYATYGDYYGNGSYAGYYGAGYPITYNSFYGPSYSMPAFSNQGTAFSGQENFGQQRNSTEAGQTRANPDEATLVVDLPANARLTIDGQPTQLTSATRTFITPPLQSGREYYYDLKAQLDRNGKTLTATKRVTIRPGQETRVHLDFAGQTTSTAE